MANNTDCWAKIDKSEGSLDETLNIYFDENDTGGNRSVKIRVTSPDGDITEEYTLVQKKKEEKIYYNARLAQWFTRDNCNEETEKGQSLEYVVEAGTYTSTISQEEADQKALDDIDRNGQAWVNAHAECVTGVWYNTVQMKSFTKNDCDPDTEKGTSVTYTIPAGTFSSTISQADADSKAKAALEEGGQAYANAHGECETIRWYNREQSKRFQKNDCLATEVGSWVEYTVPAGKYYSGISQADADDLAIADLNENGQAYANEHGECATSIWYNEEKSETFTRNNCEPGFIGGEYEYVVPAGKYSSTISQDDANQKALDEIEANGQAQANINAECTEDPNYFVGKASKQFTKNDCEDESQYGSTVTVTQDDVTGGPFISRVSQEEADALAMEAVEEQGQAIANERGQCLDKKAYTGVFSQQFTKNNCADGGTGTKVTVDQDDVAGGPFISYESQQAANDLAKEAVLAQGQAIANEQGSCSWRGEYEQSFTKNDCEEGKTGSAVVVSEEDCEGYPFISTESKAAADALAEEAVKSQGQAIANEEGTCNDMTLYNGRYSKKFTKNDCVDEGVGSEVTVTQDMVDGGPFTSYESQSAANALAQAAVEEQGQAIANEQGNCTWTGEYSQSFTKDDCEEGQTGSTMEVHEDDCEGYPFTSTESKEAADALAEAAVKAQGQGYVNEHGNCEDMPVYTGRYSKDFTRNNCEGEGVGSKVTVTQNDVTGGPFTSYESQEAANALAQAAVEEQGQEIANTKGTCTWTGTYEKEFQKNDCEEGQTGSTMTVSEEDCIGSPFTSTESQEAADALAQAAVEEQGQGIANSRGNCENLTVYTGSYSKEFTPECEDCHEGTPLEVTATMVNGSPVTSYVSQDDADQKAQELVESQGQAYANKNGECLPMSTEPDWQDVDPAEVECQEGKSMKKQKDMNECSGTYNSERWVEGGDLTCSWNGKYQQEFQKNDCEEDQQGTTVMVTQDDLADIEESGYPFTSFESQDAANELAKAAVEQYGQQVANEKGNCNGCGYYEKMFYRNDCGTCMEDKVGIMVTSDDVGGPFCDPDPEVAQQKAQQAVEENGQAYVNKNGPECTMMNTDPVWVDSDPLETECRDGVSYKKQINTNECYAGEDEQWIPGGGRVCVWTGTCNPKTFYKQCTDDGVGSAVEVSLGDVAGDYTSTVSQEDANSKACALIDAQGQNIANSRGTCTWTATYSKQFTRNNCGTCDKGTTVNVSSDQTSGAPYKSTVSYQDALNKATNAVNSEGQSIANKNGSCVNDTSKDNPSWTDTGTTQCSGCTSQKQQRDTNQCSPSYNTTKWVNGGSRDCSENGTWGSWSSWSCSGCTRSRHRTNTCGADDSDYEYNSSYCGRETWSWTGYCSGTRSEYECDNTCSGSCGSEYRYVECQCGYGGGDYNTAVGSAQCRSGVSQRQYRDSCGNTRWVNEGTACSASYNCSNYSSSGTCSESNHAQGSRWTCTGSGTQTANGSTTSAAQSAAQAKCTCTTYGVPSASKSCSSIRGSSCTGTEGECSYTGTWSGTATGSSSDADSASGACTAAAFVIGMNALGSACSCGNKTYTYTVSRVPTASDCHTACGNSTAISYGSSTLTRTGSSTYCADAKTVANRNWYDYLEANKSAYCNCNPEYPKYMRFKDFQSVSTGYKKSDVDFWVSTDQEVIASIRMDTGDENGYMYFSKMKVKIVSNLGNDITNSCYITRSWTAITRGKSSCQRASSTGPLIGYQSTGDENGDYTVRFATTFNIQYGGKTYRANRLTMQTTSNANKKGGQINIWNQSPAGYNAIVGMNQCNDENGYFNLSYAQFELVES